MFIPYRIETLFKHLPIANWVIMVVTAVMFFASDHMNEDTLHALVLGGTSSAGIVGYLFLHGGIIHLAGNLLCLWVFGNAVCAMMNNFAYVALYLVFGVLAATAHIAFSGDPAVGASGAINGIVGMAFAMYPRNSVSVFWFVLVRAGTFEIPLWVIVAVWFVFDAIGAFSGSGDVAYWAHLGGFVAGVCAGVVGLKYSWITLTRFDHAALVTPHAVKAKEKAEKERRWNEAIYPRS